MGAAPIRTKEAVRAIMGNRERADGATPEGTLELLHRGEEATIKLTDRREIVVNEPKAGEGRIPRHHDNAVSCDAGQFAQPTGTVGPVMDGEHSERRPKRGILEGQMGGRGAHDRGTPPGALADHRQRGLDRHDGVVAWLVGIAFVLLAVACSRTGGP